jgi:hypothetical protein
MLGGGLILAAVIVLTPASCARRKEIPRSLPSLSE